MKVISGVIRVARLDGWAHCFECSKTIMAGQKYVDLSYMDDDGQISFMYLHPACAVRAGIDWR